MLINSFLSKKCNVKLDVYSLYTFEKTHVYYKNVNIFINYILTYLTQDTRFRNVNIIFLNNYFNICKHPCIIDVKINIFINHI